MPDTRFLGGGGGCYYLGGQDTVVGGNYCGYCYCWDCSVVVEVPRNHQAPQRGYRGLAP